MGWIPSKVTHTSDYFGQLYDLAIKLIKRGMYIEMMMRGYDDDDDDDDDDDYSGGYDDDIDDDDYELDDDIYDDR